MRKFLSVLAFVAFGASAACPVFNGAQPSVKVDQIVCYGWFAVGYNYSLQEPVWSAEVLTKARALNSGNVPRDERWHVDANIDRAVQHSVSDYVGTGDDKCHLTPSGDAGTRSEQTATYTIANIVPCTPQLNERIWRSIEAKAKSIVIAHNDGHIVTGIAGNDGTVTGKAGVPLANPASMYKAVSVDGSACVYVSPNDTSESYALYSLAAFKNEYGINPMPDVQDGCDKSEFLLPEK